MDRISILDTLVYAILYPQEYSLLMTAQTLGIRSLTCSQELPD